MTGLILHSPLHGWVTSLDEVPDPVFADRMMGDGVAIDPLGDALFAPCAGEIVSVHRARHAVNLRADNGAEILMHIGLDTVALEGEGFQAHVRDGQRVAIGERLISFDLDGLAQRVRSLLTPIVVTNPDAFAVVRRAEARELGVDQFLMELRAVAARSENAAVSSDAVSRSVRVRHAHGLHARPAALVAAEARRSGVAIEIAFAGRRASAASPVAVMSLGVRGGDEIVLTAAGDQAEAALEALVEVIERQIDAMPAPESRVSPAQRRKATAPAGALQGVRAAPGLAIGPAARLVQLEIPVREAAAGAAEEAAALAGALTLVKARMTARSRMSDAGHGGILDAHLAFIEDPGLIAEAHAAIAAGSSAGVAWRRAVQAQVEALRTLGDARLAERADDLIDLERQVLLALSGDEAPAWIPPRGAIVLADDLMPSQLIALQGAGVAGLCTARGGPTSHVAILAAAMDIPAVVAAGAGVTDIEDGALVILDGDAGLLHPSPSPGDIDAAQARLAARTASKAAALASAQAPCLTADGVRIEVFANVGSLADAEAAVSNGAEGCGLLRTEFLFLDRPAAPDEAEQAAQYQAIAAAFDGRPVIVRTLDVGGDKPAPYLSLPPEDNPALGVRGVRVGLAAPELLRAQIRAILQVQPQGQCRIMVPMVSSLAELMAVRSLVDEAQAEASYSNPVQVGVMIETPAAAVTADLIAAQADFLSIGSIRARPRVCRAPRFRRRRGAAIRRSPLAT